MAHLFLYTVHVTNLVSSLILSDSSSFVQYTLQQRKQNSWSHGTFFQISYHFFAHAQTDMTTKFRSVESRYDVFAVK